MNIFYKILFWGKNFLFPGVCVLCNRSLIGISEIKYSLCRECRLSANVIEGEKCRVCGKPLISEEEICVPCRNIIEASENENNSGTLNDASRGMEKHAYDRLFVLFPYTGKFRRLLAAYKFKQILPLADFFCEKIIDCIKENPFLQEAVIVPVPPRPGKIKHSGWDHVDYLVKRLKRLSAPGSLNKHTALALTVSHCLKRKKSKIQKMLNRKDRMENLKSRIYVCSDVPQTVLLIDDVITTGSTMEVCAKALKKAGAKNIYGLCLFYD